MSPSNIATGPRSEFNEWLDSVQPRPRPYYELHEDKFVVHDLVWGDEVIGEQPHDNVLLDVVHTDLMRRTMAIEQLSLYDGTTTIPNTSFFSRWEHAWGSVVFIRKLTENQPLTPRERLILQLRALFSDFGHTAYSHEGDLEFQGVGGPEDRHDLELRSLIEASEVERVLEFHEIGLDEVIAPQVVDWVERPAPDLCVDRVDYAVREFKRWLNSGNSLGRVTDIASYTLRDGQIVLIDQEVATEFAKSFLLLPTEHWGEPVHKVQEYFQRALIRHGLLADNTLAVDFRDRGQYHPYDLLRTVDADVTRSSILGSQFSVTVMTIMRSIGREKREIFMGTRQDQLAEFLRLDTADYPDPLEHYGFARRLHGNGALLPANLEVERVASSADVGRRAGALSLYLAPFKARSVDPLFIDERGEIQRLSAVDDNFRQLLQQQVQIQRQAYAAYLHVSQATRDRINKAKQRDAKDWLKMLERPRMPPDVMRRVLHFTGGVAISSRLIDIDYTA